jgi:hypothetical protein
MQIVFVKRSLLAVMLGFSLAGCTPPDDPSKPLPITETNPLTLPVVTPIDLRKAGSVAELIFEIPERNPDRPRNFLYIGINFKVPTWIIDGSKWSEILPLYTGKKPLLVELIRIPPDGQAGAKVIIELQSIATEEEKLKNPNEWFTPLDQAAGILIKPWSPEVLDYHAKGMRRAGPHYDTTLLAIPKTLVPGRYKARLIVAAALALPEGMLSEFAVSYARTPK